MKMFALFALAVAVAPVTLAQQQTFVANADASEVKITLQTTHEVVNGSFHIQSGSITFNRSTPAMSGAVSVLTGSGKTGNGARDKRMKKEILLAEQYATVSFEPKSYSGTIAPTGDSTIQVSGVFTLLGKPHDITVPIDIHLEGSTATAKSHFLVPYIQWGLKDPSILFWKVGKDVTIDLLLTGSVTK